MNSPVTDDRDSVHSNSEETVSPVVCRASVNFLEKYTYYFDYPAIEHSGYIEISTNNIIVWFPEKTSTETYIQSFSQNVLLFVDKHLKFSYSWLPIYTVNDFLKCKELLSKCYLEFKKMCSYSPDFTYVYYPHCHNELFTECNSSYFHITCLENYTTTSIEINSLKTQHVSHQENTNDKVHVQFFIGPNQIFSSHELFGLLDDATYNQVLQFILYKLVKY